MATPVLMPKQGQSVESCILSRWFIKKGGTVKNGDLLFAYETDKASFEEEVHTDGILLDTFFEEGSEVPVLVNVAVIGQPGEDIEEFRRGISLSSKEPGETSTPLTSLPGTELLPSSQDSAHIEAQAGPLKISPRARRLAEHEGILFNTLKGTGPEGRIIVRDVESALSMQKKVSPLAKKAAEKFLYDVTSHADDFSDTPLTNVRKIIAKAMHASLQNSAQLTHHLSADARKLLALRSKVKMMNDKGYPHNITLNDMVCYAVIKVLTRRPDANAHFLGDKIRSFHKVHLGLAVDTERGLIVPSVRNADDLSLTGLSSRLKVIADNCKNGNVDPDLLSSTAASFTVSNLGSYGVEMFTPVINLPQVCILGVNTIIMRPMQLENNSFGFVPYMGLSLTYDHRAIDGGPATRLLAEIKQELENFDINLI